MNKRRAFPSVILLLVALCAGSGVLAYRLLDQLGNGTSPLASLGAFFSSIGSGGAGDAPQRPAFNPAANAGPIGAGVATDRKWMLKSPPYHPPGTPLFLQGDDADQNGPGTSFRGFPLYFEDCDDYGGELDMFSAGADIDFFLMPGLTCIDLRRPEVNVPENEERNYEIEDSGGSRVFNACELNQQLEMCLKLGQFTPDGTGNANEGNAAANQDQPADPRERLDKWHAHFTRDSPQDPVRLDRAPKREENPAVTSGDGRNNYLTGSDPSRWFRDLPGFSRAHYRDIMPGVDLACYADQTRIEYLLTFWPGTQPSDFTFTYDEALSVAPLGSGNVAVDYDCARVLHHRPMAYHVRDGRPEALNASYAVRGNTINVRVDEPMPRDDRADRLRDGSRIPQPQLDFLSHFGGNGTDVCYALAHDAKGFAHMTGMTTSSAFSADRREQSPHTENTDVFVVRFASANHQLHTSTFIGGSHDDRAFAIVADEQGNSYICGETLSPNFPSVGAPAAGVSGRGWDAFVAKLDAITGEIVFAYRIGGAGDDRAYGIALDPNGNIVLTGMTYSDDFPTGPDAHPERSAANGDAFLIKLSKEGDRIIGGSRFGGSDSDHAFGLTTDAHGFSYVVGETRSDDFPVTGALQSDHSGSGWDGFIVKFDTDGTTPIYATRLGGRNDDHAYCVAVDLAGYAYVGGETSSEDFPTMSGLQTNYAGGEWDGFVMKIEPEGKYAVYSSYIGGSSNDRVYAVTADVDGHLFFGGATQSSNMPTLRAVQPEYAGGQDGFIGRLAVKGNTIDYLTFIGGETSDSIHALSLHTKESVVFAGRTSSTNLIVLQPMQSAHRGREDTLVGRLMSDAKPSPEMRLVKAKEQPAGPDYDFYVGAFETSNEEFVRFLNDAQANPSTARGTNLYFDARGNVWFNTNHVQNMHEILSIQDSRIVYQSHFPVGSRYAVTPVLPREGESYARHPVVGVSWFGAIKYCNWLTLATGRGAQERCFREGPNPLDWAPVTCSETNWARGRFTPGEREAWLKYRGFRMPMDNSAQAPMDNEHVFLVTRQEFVTFLNDAQRDPRSLKGMHLRFNAQGDVAYSANQKTDKSELFVIAQSGISYTPSAPAGQRYAVQPSTRDENSIGDPALAPVKNVSWIGAVKYCNWMSLNAGMADTDLSYREGTNDLDWAASTVAHDDWVDKNFTDQAMRDWLETKGHKLPYQSERVDTNQIENLTKFTSATNSYPNPYNEFYKASAWNKSTNGSYGFGRDKATVSDANFLGSGEFRIFDTTETGYFNGTDHDGRHPTSTNMNPYGISDLSGNVEEWLVDPGTAGSLETRACYGGSWLFPLPTVDQRFFVHPYFTDNFRGFRVTSTVADEEMQAIRLPLRICICGYGVGPGCGRGDGGEDDEEGIPGQRKGTKLGFEEDGENDHLIPSREGEEEGGEEGGGGTTESASGDGEVSGEEEESSGEEDEE